MVILVLTLFSFKIISTGFIPDEDQGILLASITLPDGASLSRTKEVSKKFLDGIKDLDGINKEKLTVFGGMIAAATLGSALTPAFYVIVQEFVDKFPKREIKEKDLEI